MEVVKVGMGHGDLSMDAYCQVWEECYGQVNVVFLQKMHIWSLGVFLKSVYRFFFSGFVSASSEQVHQS